ncbi:MAG: hypothetical protein IJS31_02320 [Oscillospiraceae bacterium]|nr:hypothetical protein [Oscillospiraceae bacterium]
MNLLGVSFSVSPMLVLFAAIAVYIGYGKICLLTILAAFLHECGHLLALFALGVRISSVRIGAFGAEINIAPCGRREELLSAAAGPACNLLCAAVFWRPFHLFAVLHLLLAAYNMLPVDPLDGGRILRVLFGRRIAYAVGFTFCGAIVVLSFHHALQSSDWLLFGAVCLLFLRLILQSGRCFFGASGIK